jgi:hypothetical protein
MSAPDLGEPILELTDAPTANFLRSGTIAGLVSALIFTIVHQIFISDIWFSIPIMLIAGALCGPSLGWSYGVLVSVPTLKNWLAYNLVYMAMFGILGAVSVAAFDPITTVEALIEVNESPERTYWEGHAADRCGHFFDGRHRHSAVDAKVGQFRVSAACVRRTRA